MATKKPIRKAVPTLLIAGQRVAVRRIIIDWSDAIQIDDDHVPEIGSARLSEWLRLNRPKS